MTHDMRLAAPEFAAITDGLQLFVFCESSRGLQVHDLMVLWASGQIDKESCTGDFIVAQVTRVVRDPRLAPGYHAACFSGWKLHHYGTPPTTWVCFNTPPST